MILTVILILIILFLLSFVWAFAKCIMIAVGLGVAIYLWLAFLEKLEELENSHVVEYYAKEAWYGLVSVKDWLETKYYNKGV